MKKSLLFFMMTLLLAMIVPVTAQDNSGQKCDADSIKAEVDNLIAIYLAAKGGTKDAASTLQAAQNLQDGIANLTTGCAGVTAEATPEAASVSSSDNGISAIQQGKWMLHWSFTSQTCPGTDYTSTATNRPVILKVDTEKNHITLEDIFVFGTAEFSAKADGSYEFLRNETSDGVPYSFDYIITKFEPTQIEGSATDYFVGFNCHLQNQFQLMLADANIICMVGSERGANLRSGPGTKFDRLGKLDANKPADVTGQATGDDGFVWWKLSDGGWVRSDVVSEAGDCKSVPQATA